LKRGIVPPDFVVDKTLVQLQALRAQSGEESALASSLVQRTAEQGIGGEWARAPGGSSMDRSRPRSTRRSRSYPSSGRAPATRQGSAAGR